jgi:hypothetical protein
MRSIGGIKTGRAICRNPAAACSLQTRQPKGREANAAASGPIIRRRTASMELIFVSFALFDAVGKN